MRRRVILLPVVASLLLAACQGDDTADLAPTTTRTVITTTVTVPAGAPAGSSLALFCSTGRAVTATGTVTDDALTEISGVAASRRNPGLYWVHLDSEGPATVFGIDDTGATRARVAITGATNVDWEDIAVGPGPNAATSYLFVADIGDNALDRRNVQVYRLPEPARTATVAPAEVITLRYPDHAHNAEAFLVHPTTGDWYVLTKEENGPSVLFRARKPAAGVSTLALEQLTSLDVLPDLVTAGAISPDGTALVVRTYLSVRVFPIVDGDVAGALTKPSCRGPLLRDAQGEGITFSLDGRSLVTLSEGKNVAFNQIR